MINSSSDNVKKLNSMEDSRRANIKRLEIESKEIIRSAKHQGKQIRNRAEKQTRDRRSELRKSEKRVGKKEDQVTKRLETIEKRERKVSKLEEQIRDKESELDELKQEEFVALEKVAQLTIGEAQERLMNELEKIHRVISKVTDLITTLMVIDGNIGKNSLAQLEQFNKYLNIDG